ncbi:hypothetical protein HYX08_02445 [Candidatus Woesearchaeota archaeon]|nr:hypothetical protein [Candidatus Woesearchaeota archaeon]
MSFHERELRIVPALKAEATLEQMSMDKERIRKYASLALQTCDASSASNLQILRELTAFERRAVYSHLVAERDKGDPAQRERYQKAVVYFRAEVMGLTTA